MRFKNQIVQVARRAAKSAAAAALHYSGAQDLISAVQRKAVGGARVLILSYHRVVGNLTLESERALPTLNIAQGTFRKHIEVLCETHDVVRLDDALDVLAGKRTARRDLAVITFDDGYRDVYDHAFPILREMKLPAVAYVPSAFVGTPKRLAHDRLWCALKTMEKRGLGPMSVGVGGAFEALLLRSFDGAASASRWRARPRKRASRSSVSSSCIAHVGPSTEDPTGSPTRATTASTAPSCRSSPTAVGCACTRCSPRAGPSRRSTASSTSGRSSITSPVTTRRGLPRASV